MEKSVKLGFEYTYSFGVLAELRFDLSEGQHGHDTVLVTIDVVLPFLFHERANLLGQVRLANHLSDIDVVNLFASFDLLRRQGVVLADPEATIHNYT